MKPNFCFPYPTTPINGAWYLAVALIGHADFDQPQLSTMDRLEVKLRLEEIFTQAEIIPVEWLQEALTQASNFGLTAYESADFENSSLKAVGYFLRVGYNGASPRIVVEVSLNGDSLLYLKQLQAGILELLQRGKLTKSSLTRRMKSIAPLLVFKMKEGGWVEDSLRAIQRQNEYTKAK